MPPIRHTPLEYEKNPRDAEPKLLPGRRIGRFSIGLGLIHGDRQGYLMALAGCIVLRAEMPDGDTAISYTALHDDFDLVPFGAIPPTYDGLLTKHPDGSVTREWRKIEPS